MIHPNSYRKLSYSLVIIFVFIFASSPASAIDLRFYEGNNILYYNPDQEGSAVCSAATSPLENTSGTGTNKDYKGAAILNDSQLKAVEENSPFYKKAEAETGVPWHILAAIHFKETGLKRYNPDDGSGNNTSDGPYQILTANYPVLDSINDEMFQKQTTEAANFVNGKSSNPELLRTGDIGVVKDVFFSYNGRASLYAEQAKRLGFSQAYEGSPYVMNVADEPRDPAKNPKNWGQITSNGGSLEYPANSDHGAYVVFAALSGISITDSCQTTASGPVAQKVVALAEQELKRWTSGELKEGTDFHKYSQGRTEAWCADFVSWLFNQAGYPLIEGSEGNVPAVDTLAAIGKKNEKFTWHDAAGYTPKPGDIQIQQGAGVSHTSIVVSVDGDKIMKIGGNQSGTSGATTSEVTKDNWMLGTTGYVTAKGGE